MSTTASAHLMYGYYLGGGEGSWHVQEADEDGEWNPDWMPTDGDDVNEALIGCIIQAKSDIGPDPHPELWREDLAYEQILTDSRYPVFRAWRDACLDAQNALGLEVEAVGGSDYSERVLTVVERDENGRETFPLSVDWAETCALDLLDLNAKAVALGWADRVREAVRILGATPVHLDGPMWRESTTRTPVQPSFILAASYG